MSNLHPDDSMEAHSDLSEVLELDPVEALQQVKKTVAGLLKFKRDVLLSREYEDFRTTQQYQAALQKLESEVRNHIKIEQQLKLHIESTQSRMEEMEKQHSEKIERLRRDLRTEHGENRDHSVGREHRREDKNKLLQEAMQLRHSAKKDQQRVLDLEKRIGRLEAEAILQKNVLQEKQRECEKLQRDLQRAGSMAVLSHKENMQSAANLRPSSSKRSFVPHVDSSREEVRPVSPFLSTSQAKLKVSQRSGSLERLRSTSRPTSALKKSAKAR